MDSPPRTPRSWVERELGDVFDEAARSGPLWTLHRVVRGELGPRWLHTVTNVPGLRVAWLGTRVGFRIAAIGLPVLLTVGILALDGALLNEHVAWQFVVIGALVVVSAGTTLLLFLAALRRTHAWVVRRIARWSLEDVFWSAAMVIVMPAITGAVLTAGLVHRDRIGAEGVPTTGQIPFRTFETFLWSLADSIPILKIPETLNWKPSLSFTTLAGGLSLLAYKLVLIVPLTQLITGLLARWFGEPEEDEEEGPAGGPEQTTPLLAAPPPPPT